MPGTPTVTTWWTTPYTTHTVGNRGYVMMSGAPSPYGVLNDTVLAWLDETGTGGMTSNGQMGWVAGSGFAGGPSGDPSVRFQLALGTSWLKGEFATGAIAPALRRTIADEAEGLNAVENGCILTYAGDSHFDFPGGDWSSFEFEWLGTCLDGGCAGEPHFVGFDKRRFDYQGVSGHWYTLMDCPMLRVSAEFTELDPTAFGGTTFMTAMRVRIGDDPVVTLRLTDFPDQPADIPANQILNLDRGLVRPLQTVEGLPTGTWVRKFPGGELAITCLVWNQIKFLNLGIRLIDLSPKGLTGILGQTLQPRSKRVENDTFDEGILS